MVTKDGLPVGYQVFPGNTYEGHTLIPVLQELRKKYQLDKIIFVADSGLLNKDNLEELESLEAENFEYIVGCRLKNLPKSLQQQILTQTHYESVTHTYRIGSFYHKGRKLIVTYSDKRARKDSQDRLKAIEHLEKKLEGTQNPKEYLSNYGYKKYLKVTGTSCLELNTEKIAEDSRWDGLHGVITNAKDLSHEEVLAQYTQLWQIENAFRITKHDLKVRPIFHWKPHRVKAHLAISFMAYALVKHLEYRVRLQYTALSPESIRQNLIRVQTSILYDNRKHIRYGFPSKISEHARKIYKLCRVNCKLIPYIIEKK
jgi:transposase